MGKKLTNDELSERISNRDCFLYQVDCIARVTYADYCCDYILKKEIVGSELKNIACLTRYSSYNNRAIHDKITVIADTNRGEEIFVLKLFKESKEIFPNLMDYQVPLKNKRSDKGYGKIDFVYGDDSEVFLVEVKADYSSESILKAIIEVQTYYQQLDKEKFLKDFGRPTSCKIRKEIVIFDNTIACRQLSDDKIKRLLDLFDIKVTVLSSPSYERIS